MYQHYPHIKLLTVTLVALLTACPAPHLVAADSAPIALQELQPGMRGSHTGLAGNAGAAFGSAYGLKDRLAYYPLGDILEHDLHHGNPPEGGALHVCTGDPYTTEA